MNRMVEAKLLRGVLVAAALSAVLIVVVGWGGRSAAPAQLRALLPFVCVAATTAVLLRLRSPLNRVVERLTRYREVTPYSALADAAQRLNAGSVQEALPGLAQVLADGTGARGATVWLAVGERLVAAARYPPAGRADGADPRADTVENLAVLLARPDTAHVVPVLDGSSLRAALSIDKPDMPIDAADQTLMRDVAKGAALLLRGVALNAELAERVRRADDLAAELQASRQRLLQAREVEQRRLRTELSRTTTGRLATLRGHVVTARGCLDDGDHLGTTAGPIRAGEELERARVELDELLDRFRLIARGVYPAVLRGQGPVAAFEELVADLPRPVRVSGDFGGRLAWEIESGVYYTVAAALNVLAAQPRPQELHVQLSRADGRVRVLVADPAPVVSADHLRASLVDDTERLAALGGGLDWFDGTTGQQQLGEGPERTEPLRLLAWLPDHLEPLLVSGPDEAPGQT